jgi:hypothetical protein
MGLVAPMVREYMPPDKDKIQAAGRPRECLRQAGSRIRPREPRNDEGSLPCPATRSRSA